MNNGGGSHNGYRLFCVLAGFYRTVSEASPARREPQGWLYSPSLRYHPLPIYHLRYRLGEGFPQTPLFLRRICARHHFPHTLGV